MFACSAAAQLETAAAGATHGGDGADDVDDNGNDSDNVDDDDASDVSDDAMAGDDVDGDDDVSDNGGVEEQKGDLDDASADAASTSSVAGGGDDVVADGLRSDQVVFVSWPDVTPAQVVRLKEEATKTAARKDFDAAFAAAAARGFAGSARPPATTAVLLCNDDVAV